MTKAEQLNLEQYLLSIYQLKDVIRYNCRKHLKDESVAEHSYFVALICLKVCDDYELDDNIKFQCLTKAILHDMPEIELNDITHNVKEKLNLRPFLKKYEDEYYRQHYSKYYSLMTSTDTIIDTVVLLADAMSVYQFTLNELTLGNKSNEINNINKDSLNRIKDAIDELKNKITIYFSNK